MKFSIIVTGSAEQIYAMWFIYNKLQYYIYHTTLYYKINTTISESVQSILTQYPPKIILTQHMKTGSAQSLVITSDQVERYDGNPC